MTHAFWKNFEDLNEENIDFIRKSVPMIVTYRICEIANLASYLITSKLDE